MGRMLKSVAMDSPVSVDWERDPYGQWYTFEADNLDGVFGSGVCIVWCEGENEAALFVGHGDLAHVLHEFCENRAVAMYRKLGPLYFTWAEMPASLQRGAARYLTEQVRPVFEDAATLVPGIVVNLPE